MVKLTGPCFSLEAHGTLAGSLTFQKTGVLATVRSCPVNNKPASPAQTLVRIIMTWALSKWHQLTDAQVIDWENYVDPWGFKGYHAFVKQFTKGTHDGTPQAMLADGTLWYFVGDNLVGEMTTGGGYLYPPIS